MRRAGVARAMDQQGLDGVLILRPSSVEYLCGHHTVETLPQPLLAADGRVALCVPNAEIGRAWASSCPDEILHYSPFEDGLALCVAELANRVPTGARVGIEVQQHYGVPPRTVELLRAAGLEVVDSEFLVERLRLVLSTAEISCVEHAAQITGQGIAAIQSHLVAGPGTDSSLASAIRAALTRDANSMAAFDVVVASGWKGGVAHSTFSQMPIGSPSVTFLEFAGAHHRYVAPVMRTVALGPVPTRARQLEQYAVQGLAAVLENAKPGVECREVARAAIRAIGRLPDDVAFHFNFGYPISVAHPPSWMDGAPFYLVETNSEPLREGMVFHAPMSFRVFGQMGVGLSQTFVVESGGTRVLTPGLATIMEIPAAP
ncbi:MAG: hypothetical protein A2W26_10085 [Acidobacteria bacterium RBG_16_64_8]|nr:MAG: hypothetical protein A2W26_10085 [Acidobacteria bacterium RBG_16_64_8]